MSRRWGCRLDRFSRLASFSRISRQSRCCIRRRGGRTQTGVEPSDICTPAHLVPFRTFLVLFVRKQYQLIARRYQVFTSSTISSRDGIKCSRVVPSLHFHCTNCAHLVQSRSMDWDYVYGSSTILRQDGIRCMGVVTSCGKMGLGVRGEYNLTTRLYQVSTSNTILEYLLHYSETDSTILLKNEHETDNDYCCSSVKSRCESSLVFCV